MAQLKAARELDAAPLFPHAARSDAAGGGDGGSPAHHAGVQQLPRADRRRAGQAGRARRAGPLRHGHHRLALPQRHARPAPGARAGAGRVAGHRGRARVHHRPSGQRRRPGHDPRARRHRGRRLRRPRVDPGRGDDLPRQAPRVSPQPPGPARAPARAGRRGRRRHPRRRRRRLLHGGRRRAAARDLRPVRPLRRAADGRRGARARACSARAARGPASCSASRTASTCGWRRSRSRWPPAAAWSPGPQTSIEFLRIQARLVHLHRIGGAGRGRRRAGRGPDLPLGRGAGAVRPRSGQRRATCIGG